MVHAGDDEFMSFVRICQVIRHPLIVGFLQVGCKGFKKGRGLAWISGKRLVAGCQEIAELLASMPTKLPAPAKPPYRRALR